ncbi:CLUMA_CG008020, isoform A [Clunio marinus]|uniref:CLUMA_CG008020, isoform A n=1 Tax=Clunio marinus TaxID=568069 RepID=A0A1J1I2T9_9DIPT|nr:CLUMA_CG008020, isoform A [Clunio marinus]
MTTVGSVKNFTHVVEYKIYSKVTMKITKNLLKTEEKQSSLNSLEACETQKFFPFPDSILLNQSV